MTNNLSPRFLSLFGEEKYITVRELFTKEDICEITKQYLETALWDSVSDSGLLYTTTNVYAIEYEDRFKAAADVLDFLSLVSTGDLGILSGLGNGNIGHNLWLNRTGAGEGFWSRGLKDAGDRISEIAKSMGEVSLYEGDDGAIHLFRG